MRIKGITDEDFVNYKVPSLFIATERCDMKCNIDCGRSVCQNARLRNTPSIDMPDYQIVERYKKNPITKAIVLGGLDPFDQFGELRLFIRAVRLSGITDDIVIYTGFNKDELMHVAMPTGLPGEVDYADWLGDIAQYPNIIVKFGRYIPDCEPHFDPVLGVKLASDNQYAERIS